MADAEMIVISRADPRGAESLQLNEKSWGELKQLYPEIDRAEFFSLDFTSPGSAFLVARLDEKPVGCGAVLRISPKLGEIKRIFVDPGARQRGIGRRILMALESIARSFGYTTLQLETGLKQPAAIKLYENAGFERIPNYGRYRNDPMSVCFGKTLSDDGAV